MNVRSGPLRIVVLGLSLSSSWGNGHATTYRALLKALSARGHDILFLERDVPWYSSTRDLPSPDYCTLDLYSRLADLERRRNEIASADLVVVGSYVPEGIAVGRFVQATARGITAFYDIDTPVTLAALEAGECDYLSEPIIGGYDLYLSFTGGPVLDHIERRYGVPAARALYCSVDIDAYAPSPKPFRWDLSFLGTYSADRQAARHRLLIEPARSAPHLRLRCGAQYPNDNPWPENVECIEHVPPISTAFYSAAVHAECHARRNGACRIQSERTAFRSGSHRNGDYFGRLGGARHNLSARPRNHHCSPPRRRARSFAQHTWIAPAASRASCEKARSRQSQCGTPRNRA